MTLIDHFKQFLFGHVQPPSANMAEYMAAAARVGDAARKAGADIDDDGGPFGSMAKEMRNGARPPKPSRKRSKRAAA